MQLRELAEQYQIHLTQQQLDDFDVYMQLLIQTNKQFNLTSITDPQQIQQKHFLDSMLGARLVPHGASLCDVGSGAGFPALPLLILRPDLKVTMIDSLKKRVNFLNQVCQELQLNAQCIHSRVEELAHGQLRESFDVVTARAVARLNTLCEYTLPMVRLGGVLIAYKAVVDDELQQAQSALKVLGGRVNRLEQFILPQGEQRTIIVVDKVNATPDKYPRGGNKERDRPL